MKFIKKIIKSITKLEHLLMVVAFVLMVISYFISVVNRNIIKGSAPWTEEIALFSMVYMALLGMELGLRDGTQVSVTALTSKLEGNVKKVVWLISKLVLLVFLGFMFYHGLSLVSKQMIAGQTSPVLKLPMFTIYFSLVLAFGISLIVQIVLLIVELKGGNTDEITGLKTNTSEVIE